MVAELVKVETSLLLHDAVALLQGCLHSPHQHEEAETAGTARTNGQPGALYAAFHDQPQPDGPVMGQSPAGASGIHQPAKQKCGPARRFTYASNLRSLTDMTGILVVH